MSLEFLDQLESRIQEAGQRLAELRESNRALEGRIAELEAELAEAGGDGDGGASWQQEREELRRRIEQLVARLESLLEE